MRREGSREGGWIGEVKGWGGRRKEGKGEGWGKEDMEEGSEGSGVGNKGTKGGGRNLLEFMPYDSLDFSSKGREEGLKQVQESS